MYSQGGFNPQSGQGPQAPRPPPYLQHPSTPPVLLNNFQQGPSLSSPQGAPHLPFYQHGPMGHFAARPVPPGGMPNSGQPYLPPPPPSTIPGNAPQPPHMFATAQQKLPHSSYVAPGSAPPSIPYQGSFYRAPPRQLGGVHGLHQNLPPPPPRPPNNLSYSVDPAVGNSQTSSMAPSVPLPPPPPLPPLPASSSPLPAPPCSPPPVSSSTPASMVLPTDSLSCSKGADSHGEYDLSLQRTTAPHNPPPPKPKDEKIVGKIEELCQLILKNGPSYENFIRHKESKNPEYTFLFGGEPGSEAATAHNYFLWMKTQRKLECKVDEMVNMTASTMANTTKPDASADSDMEMEDDITGSEVDQAGSHPMLDEHQATGSISHRVEMSLCSSSRLGEQGSSTLVSHVEDEAPGRSGFGVECPVVISQGDAEFPFSSYKDDSSKFITGAKSLHREEAVVADMMNSDKNSGKAMDGSSSPFRFLQNYASDDSSENDVDPCLDDANPKGVSQSAASKSHRDTELNMKVNSGSTQPCKTETGVKPSSESCQPVTAPKSEPISVATESFSEDIEIKHENYSSSGHIPSSEARVQDFSAGPSASADLSSKSENANEDKRSSLPSNAQKIDKFGRLVREGASDSDSDDSHRTGRRRKRGRSRSWSRSRSPLDRRRRRRRSPRRRREKRSRSRSWSPRNRRSRSRSPSFRHTGSYKSNSIRRDRGQIPQCFDFQRGKCYRGASCQFMHHGSEKSEGSRHHKRKQQNAQLTPSSKNHKSHDGYLKPSTKSSNQDTETIHNMEDTVSATLDPENLRVVAAEVRHSKIVQERQIDGSSGHGMVGPDQDVADSFPSKHDHKLSMLTSHDEASKSALSSSKNSIEKSQVAVADPTLVNADNTARETVDTSIADSSRNQVSKTSPKNLCAGDILPNADYMHDSSLLPTCPTSGPNLEGNSAPQMAQLPTDCNFIPQTSANESKSASLQSYPSYMLPNQSSVFSVTSAASFPQPMPPLPLPPQIPTFNLGTTTMAVTSQFQQSGLLPRSNFGNQMLGTYSTVNSQVSDYQHRSYPPVSESHHSEDSRLKPLSGSNISDSRFGVTGIIGQDSIKQLPVQGVSASSAFGQISQYSQPTYFLQNPPPNNVPLGEIPNSSQIHSHFQQQLPYDLHHSMHDNAYNAPGKLGAASRYPTDLQDRNQPLHLPEFGVTRSSTHFNPYASTFDKPLSSRFISNTFMPDKGPTYSNKPDDPSSASNVLVDEPGAGSRHGMSAPFSRVVEDKYDPLFDSIEPPSNLFKKSDHVQKSEPPRSSDIVQRLKKSSLPLDEEESNKKKDFGFAGSPDIEEFGETADAEVGDVENGSQSGSDALGNTGMGEVEIDQVKSSGKGKKSKDSRSMKLFKVCVADFVKEVLKPSWRQGNMSKEAFKTVVKKTVDKVSGAMKNRKVPKSKAKINQYIDSSQRKLTKLVMGYVDKYAKG